MGLSVGFLIAAGIGAAATGAAVATGTRKVRKDTLKAERAEQSVDADPVKTVEAVKEVKEERTDIRKRRLNLFRTAGGASGEELDSSQITQRKTLLGN